METNFVGTSYEGRSIAIDGQESMNLFPEAEQPDSKSVRALLGTPGLAEFCTLTNAIRGLYCASNGRLLAVAGPYAYEIFVNGSSAQIGELNTVQGVVTMADSGSAGNQLIIVDGTFGYIYDFNAATFTNITQDQTDENGAFPGGSHVVFIDSMFVNNQPGTFNFWWSNLLDGNTWNGANVHASESTADPIMSIVKVNNQLWCFGTQKTEIFWDAGVTAEGVVDFQRIDMAILDLGTSAKFSVSANGSTVFWLGSNEQGRNSVWMNKGYVPMRISTHAIEYLIGQLPRIDDAIGFTYQQEGHMFYVLNFLTSGRTFVFDQTTNMWHERSTWDEDKGVHNAWRPLCHALFNNNNYVGDSEGNILKVDLDCHKDNGGLIRRERTCPHIHSDRKRIFFKSFEVDLEHGVSDEEAPDAQCMLKWSDDGGFTWSNEYWHPLGKTGEHLDRVHWHKLGSSRDRVFRFAISDPVKVVLIGATMSAYVEKYDD